MAPEEHLHDLSDDDVLRALRGVPGWSGATDPTWTCERLGGGTVADVFRFLGTAHTGADTRPWSLVLKILMPWERPNDALSWRRERSLYECGAFELLPPSLAVPCCYRVDEPRPLEHWLWLEDIGGRTGSGLEPRDYALAARGLARFQARCARAPETYEHAWLGSRSYVPEFGAYWRYGLEAARRARREAGQATAFASAMAEGIERVNAASEALSEAYRALPTTLCHRDYYYANLFVREDCSGASQVVAIDWDTAGPGPVGEDTADLVAETVFDFGLGEAEAAGLREAVLEAYLTGLRDEGMAPDPSEVRLAYGLGCALHWLPRVACMAHRAPEEEARPCLSALEYLLPVAERTVSGLEPR